MKRNISIKIKLTIPLLLILILVFFASSLVIIQRETQESEITLIKGAESFSSLSIVYIINNYELYYDSGFYKYIEIIDNLMSLNENVERIQILNINGKIVFDSNEIKNGKYNEELNGERIVEDQNIINKIGSSTASTEENNINNIRSIEIIQPYIDEWGRHDYSVRYFISLTSLVDKTNEMYITVFIYTIIFILTSFLLIFFIINNFITKPLGNLREAVKMMSAGKLGYKVKIESNDEIGDLGTSFNHMSQDLKISREKLEEYSKNLEKQVKERTKELNEKKNNLEKINKDLKKARNELSLLNKNLEDKVKERTAEIEKLLKQKNDFINQLGHDLKTPLGPLMNLIPILEEKETNPKRKEMLNILKNDVNYMKNLVVKTLELARLNSPKTKSSIKKLIPSEEIIRIISYKKNLFDSKNIQVIDNIDKNHRVKADKQEFEELMINILENAVKYNKNNGKIEIKSKEKDDNILISIKDTGLGMTQEQISHIFEEFYKADQSRHDIESSGLGMSICKRIIERNNGKIWVESLGINKGTTVFISLPKFHN